jgi:hypothetical protein
MAPSLEPPGGKTGLQKETKAGGGVNGAIGQEAVHIVRARFVQCSIVG